MSNKFCKISVLWLLLLCGMQLFGQLTVGLSFNRSRYMRYEHIYACVTIRNDSGRPLLFGQRPELQGFILFDIRDHRNHLVQRRENQEFSAQGLYIAPGEVKNIVIPLHKYYKLDKEGSYKIHAYVSSFIHLAVECSLRYIKNLTCTVYTETFGFQYFDYSGFNTFIATFRPSL